MKAFGTLLIFAFQILVSSAIAGEEDKGRILSLKSGDIEIKPLGNQTAQSSEVMKQSSRSLMTRFRLLWQAPAVDQPISGQHVILEFERRLQEQDFAALEAKGVKIWNYVQGTSYTATINFDTASKLEEATKDAVKCIGFAVIESQHKLERSLGTGTRQLSAPGKKKAAADAARVSVELYPDADFQAAKAELSELGRIENDNEYTKRLDITLPSADLLQKLTDNKYVKFVSPKVEPAVHNTHIRKNVGADIVQANQPGLSGTNIRVAIFDGGHVSKGHPSFQGRLSFDPAGDEHTAYSPQPHPTHVAGTIAGNGAYQQSATSSVGGGAFTEAMLPGYGDILSATESPVFPAPLAHSQDPQTVLPRCVALEKGYPGVAPGAQIVSYDFTNAANKLVSVLIKTPQAIDLANNSWGEPFSDGNNCPDLGKYTYNADIFDAIAGGHVGATPVRRIPIVFSAGNDRSGNYCRNSNVPPYLNYRTVSPPGTAKNVITVGAINPDNNVMPYFSAYGPTKDGRIKPDVVAPGCRELCNASIGIVSAVPQTEIGKLCGTSQAAPVVSGMIALMMQKLQDMGVDKITIYPSTYKALLIHAAEDLGTPGPDYAYGYGRVRLPETIALLDKGSFSQDGFKSEGDTATKTVAVPAGAKEIKVTLAWDDLPPSSLSSSAITNNLDLSLSSPSNDVFLPWILNLAPGKEGAPASRGVDRANVVEQVSVPNPVAGNWQITVKATQLGNARYGQAYSLVVTAE